jgi:hypothetical protein
MPLPFIGNDRTVCKANKASREANQGGAIGAKYRGSYRSGVQCGWGDLSRAGNLGPSKHPLHYHVQHVEPVVEEKAHTPHARGKKDIDWFEIRGAHQRLLPAVARTSKVCYLGHRNKEIQDRIHEVVDTTGKIYVHEGKRDCIKDWASIPTEFLTEHHKVRHSLTRVGHGGHQIQGTIGDCKTGIPICLWAGSNYRLEKIEEGEDEMLDQIEQRRTKGTKDRKLVYNRWNGIAIQEPGHKKDKAVPNRDKSPKDYIGQIKDLYNGILDKWSQKRIVTPRHVGPNPGKLLIHQVQNGAHGHQSGGPKQTTRKR